MRNSGRTLLILLSSFLTGCVTDSSSTTDNTFFGRLIPQEEAVPDNTRNALLAPVLDSKLGKSMDARDQNAAYKAQFTALEQNGPNVAVPWKNTRSQNRGVVLPGPRYSINEAQCRDYTHKVVVGEQAETLRGVACMKPNGSWYSVI